MKLVSSRGSQTQSKNGKKKNNPNSAMQASEIQSHIHPPGTINEQNGLFTDETSDESSVKPVKQTIPQITAYPKSQLSEKQMEALQKVIRPSADQGTAELEDDQINALKPADIVIKDRSVVKSVFLIIAAVILVAAAGFAGWRYWWITYSTFDYNLHPVAILNGQSVAPDDFLDPAEDITDVHAFFQDPQFEPAIGLQFIPLTLTQGLRSVETAAVLYVLTPIEYYEHELAEEGVLLRPIEFLANFDIATNVSINVRFTEEPLPLEEYPVGEFPLHLAFNDVPFTVTLKIVDTTPPTASTTDLIIQIGDEVFPEDFIVEYFDASPIGSMSFYEEPDFFAHNDQTVKIIIEDIYGNGAVFSADLSIILNQEPPVIEGTGTIEAEIGTLDLERYLQGVTAFDDFGRELEVRVNDSEVDINSEGTYTILYWTEDFTGLYTEVEETVHVIAVDPLLVNQMVDDILAGIITPGMTQVDKVRAIHNWVRWYMSKSSDDRGGSESLTAVAYRALREKRGDSGVYSALSEFMLNRAGIANIRVERIESASSRHYWLLVNPDENGWHHFDPFPTGLVLGDLTSMFTKAQAEDIARRIKAHNGTEDYYTYDTELFPEVVA